MGIVPPDQIEMHRELRVQHQRAEELGSQEHVVFAQHLPLRYLDVVRKVGTSRDIQHAPNQRLVQRHQGIGISANARPVPQCPGEGLSQHDAGVLDRVMTVDVEVATGFDRQIQQRMPRQGGQHVVEEADAGLDRGVAPAVEVDPYPQIGLARFSGDFGDA